jgi:pimeloyl-ACP methyl ester carboxylesterase
MSPDVRVSRRILDDSDDAFEVTLVEAPGAKRVVLFSVGVGGDPGRHLPFLQSLAAAGCQIIAPHFARLASAAPTKAELASRARRLQIALDDMAQPRLTAAAIGHSVGAALLLALAGAETWTLTGETLRLPPERRLTRLALMAPATDFFRAPGALEAVRATIAVWVGARDDITPPAQARFLKMAMPDAKAIDVRVIADAGHFTFMNAPPPHAIEPLADRDAFLTRLAREMASFILS